MILISNISKARKRLLVIHFLDYLEVNQDVHHVIPLKFLKHLNRINIYHNYQHLQKTFTNTEQNSKCRKHKDERKDSLQELLTPLVIIHVNYKNV